jgi:hypothetical protein
MFSNITLLTGQKTPVWRLCKDLWFPISSGESELHSSLYVNLLPGVASNNLKLPRRTAFSLAQEMAHRNVDVEMNSEMPYTVLRYLLLRKRRYTRIFMAGVSVAHSKYSSLQTIKSRKNITKHHPQTKQQFLGFLEESCQWLLCWHIAWEILECPVSVIEQITITCLKINFFLPGCEKIICIFWAVGKRGLWPLKLEWGLRYVSRLCPYKPKFLTQELLNSMP